MPETRAEHLQWAKQRALEYLEPAQPDEVRSQRIGPWDGGCYRSVRSEPTNEQLTNAVNSFLSDLRKHRELADHPVFLLAGFEALGGGYRSEYQVRQLIEGAK